MLPPKALAVVLETNKSLSSLPDHEDSPEIKLVER